MSSEALTTSRPEATGPRRSFLKRWKVDAAVIFSVAFLLLLTLSAVFGPSFAPHAPGQQDLLARLVPPSWSANGSPEHLLGTDHLGRDLLSRLIVGARISLLVALISVAFSGTIGVLIGLAAGYFGGRLDALLMRIADMQLAIPFILLAIIIIGIFGPSLRNIILVLVLTNWVIYARVVRGEVISLKSSQFVEAARAVGQFDLRIILKHILPNAFNTVLVVATLDIGRMIFFESALSFLGLGVPPPTVSWGAMLADGKIYMASAWWLATFPGLVITFAILSVNQLGDWLRDVLDPKD